MWYVYLCNVYFSQQSKIQEYEDDVEILLFYKCLQFPIWPDLDHGIRRFSIGSVRQV